MRCIFTAGLIFFLYTGTTYGQERLQGLFEGTLTLGGLESSRRLRLEMAIRIQDGRVSGRSYVHLGRNEIYLEETKEIALPGEKPLSPYPRKYQLKYSGSFEEVFLNGFWQQASDAPLEEGRQLGRVRLRKTRGGKA
jgi:hypothetical protein